MLWGLHSALTSVSWTKIDLATKEKLKRVAGVN